MNARLLPWAAMALLVLFLAVRSVVPTRNAAAPANAPGPETAAATQPGASTPAAALGRPWPSPGGGAEIRLGPVDVRELHDDGTWNRLDAGGALYGYVGKTVSASDVTVHLGEGSQFAGTTVRAPRALWDLEGKSIVFAEGGRVERKDGWTGLFSAATLDLAGSVLRVPGPARIEGPGVSVRGANLAWEWAEGKITLDSTTSRISPVKGPGRKG